MMIARHDSQGVAAIIARSVVFEVRASPGEKVLASGGEFSYAPSLDLDAAPFASGASQSL
jgi:hypothetical protein